jgi:hypothetical protein
MNIKFIIKPEMDCFQKPIAKKRRRGVSSYQKVENEIRVKLLTLVYNYLI